MADTHSARVVLLVDDLDALVSADEVNAQLQLSASGAEGDGVVVQPADDKV